MTTATRSTEMTRRQALTYASAATAGLLATGRPNSARGAGISDQYAGLQSSKYIGKWKLLANVEDNKVFTEGPADDGQGNLYFTNTSAAKILKWDGKKLSVFRTESNRANGLYFDPAGNLLACEGGAGRVTRTNMKTGEITVIADKFNGFPFAAPNDLCLDAAGRLYFTSRPGTKDPKQGNVNAVYRVDPDDKVTQILAWPQVHMPNGIVTSPDDKTLYVIEAHPDAAHHRSIFAYDLDADGNVSNERTLIDFYPGRSGDGMCIDAEGNLYVAAGLHETRKTSETLDTRPGIHVITPAGKLVAFAETPEDTITNCSFGGPDLKTLYVTCGKRLLSFRTMIPGKPSYRPGG